LNVESFSGEGGALLSATVVSGESTRKGKAKSSSHTAAAGADVSNNDAIEGVGEYLHTAYAF